MSTETGESSPTGFYITTIWYHTTLEAWSPTTSDTPTQSSLRPCATGILTDLIHSTIPIEMSFRRTGLATLLLLVTIQLLREHSNVFLPLGGSVTQTKFGGGENDNTIVSIRPGDLPGYTGWGRSESTLAPFFRIVSPPSAGTSGSDITFRLECTESSVCSSAAPAFYVRAYGPSIITGIVDRIPRTKNEFDVTLKPIVDPGSYLVEVVLTFSNLPDFRLFPLPDDNAYHQFLYEGYHVLGSPFQIIVSGSAAPQPSELPLCRSDQLVETFRGSLGDRARWRVVDVVNNDKHQQNSFRTTNVTLEGYQKSLNSLGLLLDYQFRDCRLMPVPTPIYFSASVNQFTLF